MRIGILGRSEILLAVAKLLHGAGHEIAWVVTAKSEAYYVAHENDFEHFAVQSGSHFFLEKNLENSELIEKLKPLQADLVVSINWPKIIGVDFMEIFSLGIFNAHLGDLPKYRGNACPNWAIINGEEKVGLCIHKMIPNSLDSGPIYCKSYIKLENETDISDVYDWARSIIPEMFMELIRKLNDKNFVPEKQSMDSTLWLRCYPRRPSDSQINWNLDSKSIHRLIRASSKPFGGAYSYLEGTHRVNIWKAEVYEHQGNFLAIPGQLMILEDDNPIIACGEGSIKILKYNIECAGDLMQLNRLRSRLMYVEER